MALRFVLNGEPTHVEEDDPDLTLLAWLRRGASLGTKEGCAEGECGACAVAVLDRDGLGRPAYRAINSCLLPLACVDGKTLITVEGVADGGQLHPVQRALVEHGGSQCGYCTPGFVISMYCEYYRPGRERPDDEAIGGNLCRCTGYRPIRAALRALAAPAVDDRRLPQLAQPPPSRPRGASTVRCLLPESLDELFALRRAHPTALLLSGGTDAMIGVTQRHERHAVLIGLERVEELARFAHSAQELVLGATLSLSDLEQKLEASPDTPDLLRQLWPLFSSRLIRNRATLGGNLATASPIGDAAPCLLALDASLTLVSPRGARRSALSTFFRAYRQTELAADELIASVHVPLPTAPVQRFYKVSKRVLDDISTVSAAFALSLADGRVRSLRIAYGGIAATPLRAERVEQAALDRSWDAATLQVLCGLLDQVGTPLSDARGSASYRRAMMAALLEKFFHESSALRSAP